MNKEDFELQVSSPGLDAPFIVIEQYLRMKTEKFEVVTMTDQNIPGELSM